jgi:hypothetical protein
MRGRIHPAPGPQLPAKAGHKGYFGCRTRKNRFLGAVFHANREQVSLIIFNAKMRVKGFRSMDAPKFEKALRA